MKSQKNFEDLKAEIIEKGLCARCGGCVSFCSANRLNAIGMDYGLPDFINKQNCLECGICYMICPMTDELNESLEKKFGDEKSIGNVIDIISARTTSEEIKKYCSDGGVVTSLLHFLLDTNIIDGAVVVKQIKPGVHMPILASSFAEILESAGTSLTTLPTVNELKNYTSYASILPELREISGSFVEKVAVVGTPCQIKTIRKMQAVNILPSSITKFTIGLFCIENFTFNPTNITKFEEVIEGRMADIKKVNIKDEMIITFKDGRTKNIPLEKLEGIARESCLHCALPFSNIYSDISVGGLASPDGYTTVILRTEQGEKLFKQAVDEGYMELNQEWEKEDAIKKVKEFTKRKLERASKLF